MVTSVVTKASSVLGKFASTVAVGALVVLTAFLLDRSSLGGSIVVPLASRGAGRPSLQLSGENYPRTAIDADGFSVHVQRPPGRLASQFWSLDDYLYAVVPPERIVAVSEYAYNAQVSNVYPYVQRFRPAVASDPERVIRQSPDAVLVANTSRADYCELVRSTGVPIYRAFVTFSSLKQVADAIRLAGYLSGEDQAAALVVANFWRTIESARSLRRGDHAPRILGLGGRHGYGAGTLFDDIVSTIGGINVAAEGGTVGYKAISSEQVVRWNPEWIFAASDPAQRSSVLSALLRDPAIASTTAARNNHVVVVEKRVMLPLSPFSARMAVTMAEAVYE